MAAKRGGWGAFAICVAGVAFNAAVLGRATMGLSAGLVAAYALWRRGAWRATREGTFLPYVVSIAVFCAHFAEEYTTGFYRDFPRLFGAEWTAERFVAFNAVWFVGFLLSAVGVYANKASASVIVVFFALAGGILNGMSHLALSLYQWRDFPGTATAPLMLACGMFLLHRLLDTTSDAEFFRRARLVAQGIAFTILVPGTASWWMPHWILHVDWKVRYPIGWALIAIGGAFYLICASQFLLRGDGTPNIHFARAFGFLIGREPRFLVSSSLYRYSRNPMYVGVLTTVLGEAILLGSRAFVVYSLAWCAWFQIVVLFIEEPHLRRTRGDSYLEYCRRTPRWFPLGRPSTL
jgi:protein-S-isoprenylcysteine O-methyltransferase Ste14